MKAVWLWEPVGHISKRKSLASQALVGGDFQLLLRTFELTFATEGIQYNNEK